MLLHHFGHQCNLLHCSHPGCVMNRGSWERREYPWLIEALLDPQYVNECFAGVREALETRIIAEPKCLVVGYNYPGDPQLVGEYLVGHLKKMYGFTCPITSLVIAKEEVPPEDVHPKEGYILPEPFFRVIRKRGLEPRDYGGWLRIPWHMWYGPGFGGLLGEVNTPLVPVFEWGHVRIGDISFGTGFVPYKYEVIGKIIPVAVLILGLILMKKLRKKAKS